jgi:ABC-2 type transport system ATP-binding protein
MNVSEPAVETMELGRRYRRRWGLRDCSFTLPQGRVAALVGPNGAGKSTLLRLLAGINVPSEGRVTVLGKSPRDQTGDALSRVAYLDQDRPLYKDLRVEEMLRFGRELNPRWDDERARRHLGELRISQSSRVGQLSGGQQAQVALTMCLAKRPDLLLLDEPVAALDPLAREDLMQILLQSVADDGTTVLLSSHAVADLATICDYVIILSASRVQFAGELDHALGVHRVLVGPAGSVSATLDGSTVISSVTAGRQSTMLVRAEQPIFDPYWEVFEPTLDEIVLAYLRANALAEQSEVEPMSRRERRSRNSIRIVQ